jgi:hypothetical protein
MLEDPAHEVIRHAGIEHRAVTVGEDIDEVLPVHRIGRLPRRFAPRNDRAAMTGWGNDRLMRGPGVQEHAVLDGEQINPRAGVDAVGTSLDARAVADEEAVGDAQHAIRAASRQDAVLVVQEAAVLHRQVVAERPDPGAVAPNHRGIREGDPADGDIGAQSNEDALAGAGLAGDQHARPRGLDRQPGRGPDRAVRIGSRIDPDDIAIGGDRGGLGRHLQYTGGADKQLPRLGAPGQEQQDEPDAKHCGRERECGMPVPFHRRSCRRKT